MSLYFAFLGKYILTISLCCWLVFLIISEDGAITVQKPVQKNKDPLTPKSDFEFESDTRGNRHLCACIPSSFWVNMGM
jgi:hypothetical protein